MSAVINFKLTAAGQLAAWNAKKTGLSLDLTHIQLGSGNRVPDGTEVALLQAKEFAVIGGGSQITSTQVRMAALFSSNLGYEIREVGLWAGNPANAGSVLVGYWSQAAGLLAVKVGGVDFMFSHDMVLDGALEAGSLNILADTAQAPLLGMIAAHEGKADPHPQYAVRAGIQSQSYTAFAVAGAVPALTLAANPAPAKLEAGLRLRAKFNSTSSGDDTLNVNALGAKSLKELDASGRKVPARFFAGHLADIEYDGVDWVVLNQLPPFDLTASFDFVTQIEPNVPGTSIRTPALVKPRGVYLVSPYVYGWDWNPVGSAYYVSADAEFVSGGGSCGYINMTPDALPLYHRPPFLVRITTPTARIRLRLTALGDNGTMGWLNISNPKAQGCLFFGSRIG